MIKLEALKALSEAHDNNTRRERGNPMFLLLLKSNICIVTVFFTRQRLFYGTNELLEYLINNNNPEFLPQVPKQTYYFTKCPRIGRTQNISTIFSKCLRLCA